MPTNRLARALAPLLLLTVSLLATALCAELVLRLLGYHGAPQTVIGNSRPVDDPILDWRYQANSETRIGRITYRFNGAGFRDLDREPEKRPGIQRVVVLGDSVSLGTGVEWQSVFAAAIQSRIGDRFEVINIAQGGLNTPQEVHLFEQSGLLYEPDLVVLNFVLNDCDFYTRLEAAKRYAADRDSKIGVFFDIPIDPRLKRTLKSSALIYFVKGRFEELMGRLSGVEEVDYFQQIWASEENRRKVTTGFDRLASLGAEHGFDVLVMIWPLIADYQPYGFAGIHHWVEQAAKERGFAVIDLLPSFSRFPYRDLQVTAEDNVHPNALGHRIAADAFSEWFATWQSARLGRSPASQSLQ